MTLNIYIHFLTTALIGKSTKIGVQVQCETKESHLSAQCKEDLRVNKGRTPLYESDDEAKLVLLMPNMIGTFHHGAHFLQFFYNNFHLLLTIYNFYAFRYFLSHLECNLF